MISNGHLPDFRDYYEDQNQNVTDYVYKHNMGLPYVHESSYPTSLFLPPKQNLCYTVLEIFFDFLKILNERRGI